MMEWTDRHDRFFLRLISRHARLYTEMITTAAMIHGNRPRFLHFDRAEHPVALQLGGAEPDDLARCAEYGADAGFDEINLNCGCPSDRVQEGRFGACLMREPERVAECVAVMHKTVDLPVTVKCRIGVDDSEEYAFLRRFVDTVAAAGCRTFVVHARKAWLSGLSPKENREIPPLTYETVYRLKQEFPGLTIVINGGIRTLDAAQEHLRHVDGVMLGREAYENPYLLAQVDHRFFGAAGTPPTRAEIVRRLRPFVEAELRRGTPLAHMTRHILGLYRGEPNGRLFRRVLSENAHRPGAGAELLEEALRAVETIPDLKAVA